MAVGHIKILGLDFTFVFRHRYEKQKDESRTLIDKFSMWNDWKLGIFFKRMKVVGKKNANQPSKWHNNLVRSYMLGVNLLICKAWFTVSKNALELK